MPAVVNLLYPRAANAGDPAPRFDFEYYYKVHLPLVQDVWGPMGLTTWTVTEHKDPAEPYFLQCSTTWHSVSDFQKAVASPASGKLFADVPNYTDAAPVTLKGDVVRKWQIL